MTPRALALPLAAALAALPAALGAHPHVFVDAGAAFRFEAGRLETVRIDWRYDAFYSLLIVTNQGVDEDGDGVLSEADREVLVAAFSDWHPEWAGDAELRVEGAPVGLSRPVKVEVTMRDGRIGVAFHREVEAAPAAAGLRAELAIFDPTYFVAYDAVLPVELIGAPEGCRAGVDGFEPDAELAALQAELAEIPADETPEQAGVGALFADKVVVGCAG